MLTVVLYKVAGAGKAVPVCGVPGQFSELFSLLLSYSSEGKMRESIRNVR